MNWPLVLLAYFSLFALGLGDNIRGPAFPEILHQFSVTNSVGSMMFACSSFFSLWGAFASAPLIKKFGRIEALQVSLCLFSAGLFAMAWSPDFWILILGAGIFGFSLGIMGVVQNILATLGSSIERRQQILAGLHSMYGVSSVIAPILFASMGSTLGWRSVFYLVSFFPVVLLIWISFDDVKEKAKQKSKLLLEEASTASDARAGFKFMEILPVSLSLGSYVVVEIMVSSRLAHFLRETRGFDLERASFFVTLFFVFLLAGRLFYTVFRPKVRIATQLLVILLLTSVFLVMGIQISPYFLSLTGLSMAPFYPLAVVFMSEQFPGAIDRAVSITMTVQSLLIVLMQFSMGMIADRFSVQQSFYLGLVFAFISALGLCVFLAKKASTRSQHA